MHLNDLRASIRIFRRSPGLSISAVLALAMGIGFTTTMFSIVRGATRSLPFEDPGQLVVVTRTARQGYDVDPTAFDYATWSRDLRAFSALGAFRVAAVNIAGDGQRPERRSAAHITPNTLAILGARPDIGRAIIASDVEPGAAPVVLVGHDLWQARFAGDTTLLGRAIRVDGRQHTVVGIMPTGFGFPVNSELWIPLSVNPAAPPSNAGDALRVFGRLRDYRSLEDARAEVVALAARLAREHSGTHGERSARVMPFVELEMATNTAAILTLMLGAVSFVLLIACANVANVLLARAAQRHREIAVRTALGATRGRIVAMHLAESLGLATVGGLLGLGVAHVAVRAFDVATAGILEAFWVEFRVDGAVLLFATAAVAVAATLAGLLPGLRASSPRIAEALRDASGSSTSIHVGRLARALVFAEVALATGLLVMTMTFTRTAVSLRQAQLPFPAREIFTAELSVTAAGSDSARGGSMARDVVAALDAIPGVHASALVQVYPGRGIGEAPFTLDAAPVQGDAAGRRYTALARVSPEFFDVVGARAVRGRLFKWDDAAGGVDAAVVNERWVREHSPDRDPIGRHLWFGARPLEIVGVVKDLHIQDPGEREADGVYTAILPAGRGGPLRIMARVNGDPLAYATLVRDAVGGVSPDVPVFEVATLHDAIYADKKVLDAFAALFALFGAGALVLTMVGVYGLVSFAVTRRTREIGIRVALGASSVEIARLVLRQGGTLVAVGTLVGLVIAVGLSQVLASVTEFFEPAAPMTYVAIALALLVTAAAGLVRPVRRALALHPVDALRIE